MPVKRSENLYKENALDCQDIMCAVSILPSIAQSWKHFQSFYFIKFLHCFLTLLCFRILQTAYINNLINTINRIHIKTSWVPKQRSLNLLYAVQGHECESFQRDHSLWITDNIHKNVCFTIIQRKKIVLLGQETNLKTVTRFKWNAISTNNKENNIFKCTWQKKFNPFIQNNCGTVSQTFILI